MNSPSSTRVAKSLKRHFIDPSLAVAALEMSPSMLLKRFKPLWFALRVFGHKRFENIR